ncbi:hypothetical protein [Pseudomonas putida]
MGVVDDEVEDLKQGYRTTAIRYLRGCQTLLGIAFFAPIFAIFDIRPSFESVEIWFQRSGAITTVYARLSTTVSDMGLRKLHRPGENGDLYKLQVLDEFANSFERIRWVALLFTVIGTFIWGYGDTFLKYALQVLGSGFLTKGDFVKNLFLYASLVTGLLSALFWVISAYARVKPGPQAVGDNGMIDHRQIIDGADVKLTMRKQSIWNSRAAIVAALTALLQVAYNAWPSAS